MLTEKDYPCKCHVCGNEYVLRTTFLSSVAWYLDDGRCVSMRACDTHTAEEVRAAWNALTHQEEER